MNCRLHFKDIYYVWTSHASSRQDSQSTTHCAIPPLLLYPCSIESTDSYMMIQDGALSAHPEASRFYDKEAFPGGASLMIDHDEFFNGFDFRDFTHLRLPRGSPTEEDYYGERDTYKCPCGWMRYGLKVNLTIEHIDSDIICFINDCFNGSNKVWVNNFLPTSVVDWGWIISWSSRDDECTFVLR